MLINWMELVTWSVCGNESDDGNEIWNGNAMRIESGNGGGIHDERPYPPPV